VAVSVRIEDEAFSDRRYDVLARILGLPDADCARGKMAAVWRQCTQQQTHILSAEMVREILGDNGPEALVKSTLGETVEGGIRIRGTKGRIEWLAKLRKSARKGGAARASQKASHMAEQVPAKWVATSCDSLQPTPSAPAPAPAPVKKKEKSPPLQGDVDLAGMLAARIIQSTPNSALAKLTKSELDKRMVAWAEPVRLMRERDGHSPDEIRSAINWSQDHEFWRGVILSTENLRDKWDKLAAQMARTNTSAPKRIALVDDVDTPPLWLLKGMGDKK